MSIRLFAVSALILASASPTPAYSQNRPDTEPDPEPAGKKPLDIGDKAPPVHVEQWITSKPPALPGEKDADKHVFLVEFWATWCPPCRRSIPHLAELHEKKAKDGLVIVGITNEEAEVVKGFVGKKAKMPYHVGLDDEMATTEAWMEGVQGIPHAFLVDKAGMIVWTGNPLDTTALDSTIDKVLAGKFDLAAARNAAAAARKYDDLMKELRVAYAAKHREKALKLLDEMIALKPDELHPHLIKRQMLAEFEMHDALAEHDRKMEDKFKDSLEALVSLLEMELNLDYAFRDAERMERCARRAEALAKDRDAEVLALVARVRCELGMIDAAIAAQEKALGVASPEEADGYRKVLHYYRAAQRLAKRQPAETAPGPPSQ